MDLLSAISGSRVRADILAALFGGARRSFGVRDLGRELRRPHQSVSPELRRLVATGVVRQVVSRGRHLFEADLERPPARELAALVRQSRGRIPSIRSRLLKLRTPTLCWFGPRLGAGLDGGPARPDLDLMILTSAPRTLVRVQLADLVDGRHAVQCMSIREWVTRLDKGDVGLRHVRRARKVWVVGGWSELISRERAVIESRRTLEQVVANWRDELSDDWDDDWDPSRVAIASTR